MPRAYVSIGSNIQAEHNISQALSALDAKFSRLEQSPVYKSKAIGFEGCDFLNLVVSFDSQLMVQALCAALREIEEQLGRKRGNKRFAARIIDLDLLLYGTLECRSEQGRQLPSPEILLWAHVIKPLADLAPEESHPVLGQTFLELWNKFDDPQQKLQRVDWNGELKR